MLARSTRAAVDTGIASNELVLSFLYDTSTIRRNPAFYHTTGRCMLDQKRGPRSRFRRSTQASTISRRATPTGGASDDEARSQPRVEKIPDIPFERPERKKDPYGELELEGSTITPNERKAFEDLFNLESKGANATVPAQEAERIEKSTQNDPTGQAEDGNVAHNASHKIREKLSLDADGRRTPGLHPALQAMKDAQKRDTKPRSVNNQGFDVQAHERIIAAEKELNSICRAISFAQSDFELWNVLHERILNRVSSGPGSMQIATATDTNTDANTNKAFGDFELSALSFAFVHAFRILSKDFPTSALALSLLPRLKQLPSPACTHLVTVELYNYHLSGLWKRYPADIDRITSLLSEMIVSKHINDQTIRILDQIWDDCDENTAGERGESLKVVWGMGRMRRGFREIVALRVKAMDVLTEKAMEKARREQSARDKLQHSFIEA